MSRRKSGGEGDKIETGAWLTTYADLMNNLLVLFMMLYAISITNMEKFKAISDQFKSNYSNEDTNINENVLTSYNDLNSTSTKEEVLPDNIEYEIDLNTDVDSNIVNEEKSDTFNLLYEKVKVVLLEKGYDEFVTVEMIDEYIYFRFKDGILFYPDLPEMKAESNDILSCVGDLIKEADALISAINISGYTARVGDESVINFFSWELSVNRSITVLKYLIKECNLPQSKMSVAGYAHFQPFGDDSTPEGRALNRRVEIRITRDSSKN